MRALRWPFLLMATAAAGFGPVACPPTVAAQEPSTVRHEVGAVEAEPWVVRRSPAAGAASVRRHEVERSGASFLKPHFSRLHLRPGETLTVRDGAGTAVEVLRGRGPAGGEPFWGLAVRGQKIVFELHLRPTAGGVRGFDREPVRLDRVAVGDGGFLPIGEAPRSSTADRVGESLCGDGDFEDIECYRGDAAKFDAMLSTAGVLTAENGSVFWCTGVNVSPRNLVLTAESCLASTAACRDAEFVFGFYRDGCGVGAPVAEGWRGYRCVETVASSPFGDQCEPTPATLDFSLHRVDGDPANEWGWSDPADVAPASGERLYIPQHADGRPLEVTHGEGADVELDGMTLRYYGTLDTESSSVGAPIFRDGDV
ncbi:MAG: trypsin-like peptidase domain-containing protein, partial [Acidobacteriota bacterium]